MVSMMSTFAMRWFMPRLTRFQHKHPNIEIQTSATMRPMDFEREDIDAAIRNGAGKWRNGSNISMYHLKKRYRN